jgi:hypothetical protein
MSGDQPEPQQIRLTEQMAEGSTSTDRVFPLAALMVLVGLTALWAIFSFNR